MESMEEDFYKEIRASIEKNNASGFVVISGNPYFIHADSTDQVLEDMEFQLNRGVEPVVVWNNTRENIQRILETATEYNLSPEDTDLLKTILSPIRLLA